MTSETYLIDDGVIAREVSVQAHFFEVRFGDETNAIHFGSKEELVFAVGGGDVDLLQLTLYFRHKSC
jgi:hypothetical protein